ncbi:Uncharacterized protein LW93_6104 [Fusarium fujikuroi]|nr:Uncharacterized protein LW93_6104 [Fusarium fujikuroi]
MPLPRERRVEEQLRNIRESMKKQAVTLEAIEKNKKLSQIPLRVDDGKVCESILKKVKETSMLRLGRPKKKSNRAFKALIKSGTATVSQLVKSEAQPSPGIVSQVITLKERDEQAETKDRTRDPVLVEATVGMYETNDEETGDKWEDQQDDNRPFPSESLIVVRREKPQERQYDLVWRDGDIFSIAIDTDMYKTAFGAQLGDYQTNPIFRLDYLLENLTDAEQGNEAQNDLEDLLALELLSPEESEAEPPSESLSIEIDCQSPTYAFIGNSVDLSLDLSDTTTSLPFCVWVVCDLQSCRMFVLQEPCVVPCKHVRLEVMDISTLQRGPHYTMTFRSMSYGMLLNEEPAIGTHTELKLESFNTCQKKNGCPHTVVEGAASPEACCVRPVNLRAWLGEDIVEMEAVASIEDGVAYDDSISVNSTLKDDRDDDDEDHEDDDNNNDDKRALNLLQAVMNGMANSSDIPARIELSVLVSYVKMVDKYEFGEIYLSRALDWVDALLPSMSTSFDENAIAWLWILWRFHIPSEFKRLSAIIAQQATGRFSLEHDIHGVEIPAYIIGM